MDGNAIQVILLAIIGIFGGKEIWKYLSDRQKAKLAQNKISAAGEDELQREVRLLLDEKVKLMKEQMSAMESRMEKMEKERDECKDQIADMTTKVAVLSERLLKYTTRSRGRKNDE